MMGKSSGFLTRRGEKILHEGNFHRENLPELKDGWWGKRQCDAVVEAASCFASGIYKIDVAARILASGAGRPNLPYRHRRAAPELSAGNAGRPTGAPKVQPGFQPCPKAGLEFFVGIPDRYVAIFFKLSAQLADEMVISLTSHHVPVPSPTHST